MSGPMNGSLLPRAERHAHRGVLVGWHNATRNIPDRAPCWVSWAAVDGSLVATHESETEGEARAWAEAEHRRRS